MTKTIRNYAPIGLLTTLMLAWASPGCSGKKDEEPEEGTLGDSCDMEDEASCADGFSCSEDADGNAVCAVSPGEPCDPDSEALENGECGFDAECVVPQTTETADQSEAMGGAGSEPEGDPVCLLKEGALCDPEEPHCGNDLTCAETTSGEHRCFDRVVLRGQVSDTSTAAAIEGAHVLALDEEGSAVTDIAVSEADGSYLLDIPVVRDDEGAPVDTTFTLNGSAQDYEPFPRGIRVALPISTEGAMQEGGLYVIDNALTDIGLIPLPEGDRTMASGTVTGLGADSNVSGLLVVATGAAGSFTAVTDLSGAFTIFNLPDGEYEVKAYGAGIQIDSASISVSGEAVEDVELHELDEATTTVSGQVQIVDGNGFKATSVILVVEDTFDEMAARGDVPRGLRAPETGPVSIDGEFSIAGVPAGKYVVLAAYENDGLVRDPDTSIAGTDFVHIEVMAGEADLQISESFKVTGALTTIAPGEDGPEAVSEAPTLEWKDDSSEEGYHVKVYDAFGEEVWTAEVGPISGSATVTLPYEGPLEPGMYYQFRVQSWNQSGSADPAPISNTEDLRGVFFLPAE